jgi:type II secretory pathway component PulM
MFCEKCGKEMKDGAKVCPSCGSTVGAPAARPAKKRSKLLAVVGAITVLVIAFLGFLLSGPPASHSAIAIRIMNDLRNLKSASLLYYGDNLAWPANADVSKLDKYCDRPIVNAPARSFELSGGNVGKLKYESVTIGGEYTDNSGTKRANIGFEFSVLDSNNKDLSASVAKILAGSAKNNGLLNDDSSLTPYNGKKPVVFVNMK